MNKLAGKSGESAVFCASRMGKSDGWRVVRQARSAYNQVSCQIKPMNLSWKKFTSETLEEAQRQCFCLYVFHHSQDGDRPYYIGKAKYFGAKQISGYTASARYNSGYIHLVAGMLRSGFSLYIASIGEAVFTDVESYEQDLIAQWSPVRKQKIKQIRKPVFTERPWANS